LIHFYKRGRMSDLPPLDSVSDMMDVSEEEDLLEVVYPRNPIADMMDLDSQKFIETNHLSPLECIPNELLALILKRLSITDVKSIRLCNSYMLRRARHIEKIAFRVWKYAGKFTVEMLRLFSDQVYHVKGISIGEALTGSAKAVDDSIAYLLKNHPEFDCIKLVGSALTDKGLQHLLSHPIIEMVYIIRADFTGDQLNPAIKHSQTLKKMGFMSCKKLTSSGIIRILEWSGANLTSLDLSYLDVTFSKPLPFSLIHLEELDLSNCNSMTDNSVVNMLNVVGEKLFKFNISNTEIGLDCTEMSGLKVRFPSLLQLSVLFNVTIREHDLFSFLNRVGASLKRLDTMGSNLDREGIGKRHPTINIVLPVLSSNC